MAANPDIPWHDIILAHETALFTGIDDVVNQDVIWNIVQTDIPTLIPRLERLLKDTQTEQP